MSELNHSAANAADTGREARLLPEAVSTDRLVDSNREGTQAESAEVLVNDHPTSAGSPTDPSPLSGLARAQETVPTQPDDDGTPPPPPSADRYLGCTIDKRYKVEEAIGEGGMGVVYRCRHKIIDKRVAIKILRADLARDPEVTERFLMEARAASAIQSEHIIDISDFGQLPDGAAYFVMEYLSGRPLSLVAGGGHRMPLWRILHVALQLTEGLAAAHALGIIHRDLKPDNVFLINRGKEADFVKILDFGIAKVSRGSFGARLTRAGSVFGTPHYMSPEQASGAGLDHRGDIYALGVILYELAAGVVPFDADNFVAILSQQLYQEPIPLRTRAPEADIPEAFESLVMTCLRKKPDERYQSMQELHAELRHLQAELDPARYQASPTESEVLTSDAGISDIEEEAVRDWVPPPPRRWPVWAAAAVPFVMMLAIVAWWRQPAAIPPPPPATVTPVEPPTERQPPARAPAPPAEPTPPVAAHRVILRVTPSDAHIFMGEEELGVGSLELEIPQGQIVALQLRRKGYITRPIELDGTSERVEVRMKKRRKGTNPAPTEAPGGGLFVAPWKGN